MTTTMNSTARFGAYRVPAAALAEVEWPAVPDFNLARSFTYVVRRGSEAHDLYLPPEHPMGSDDRDLFGIAVPPLCYYLGTDRWEGIEEIRGPWDVVLYEMRKAVRLLCKQNPNMLSYLWVAAKDRLLVGPAGEVLLANRGVFRGKVAAFAAFAGYANSQLGKMQRGKTTARMGKKRQKLVEQFGYDLKNATTLVRLLHMGREYLSTGELAVKRTWDRDMLLDIKQGKWSLEEVKRYAEVEFAACEAAFDASTLPDSVDVVKASGVCERAIRSELLERGEITPWGRTA